MTTFLDVLPFGLNLVAFIYVIWLTIRVKRFQNAQKIRLDQMRVMYYNVGWNAAVKRLATDEDINYLLRQLSDPVPDDELS